MVTTDDYSYKPGGLAAAAAAPSFQQQQPHHQQPPPPLQLHGGGDHDKVRLPALPLPGRAGWPSPVTGPARPLPLLIRARLVTKIFCVTFRHIYIKY